MNKKIIYILVIILLVSPVSAAKFIGSFTIKETEEEQTKSPADYIINFLKNLPLVGNFAIESVFDINGPPQCFIIPDLETFKNTKFTLNLSNYFFDPNTRDILTYEQNFSYENLAIEFNQTEETADLIPQFNFIGVIDFIVIRATDPFGLFCDSNPFKLTVKEPPKPEEPPPPQPSGGGGAGSTQIPRKFPNFILSKNVIELEIYPSDTITESVNVTNIGDIGLNIKVLNSFPGFVQLITKEFSLKTKETKQADFIITAPEIEPDIYTGKIKFTAEGITRILNIVVNVLERGAEIILQVTIPNEYKRINPGDKIKADIIINTQDIPKDIDIQSQIRDIEGKTLITETESFTLNEFNTKLEKTLQTKETFEPGFYQFYVKIISNEKDYVDSDTFEITLEPIEERPSLITIRRIIIGSSILALILIITIISLFTRTKAYQAIRKKLKAPPKLRPVRLSKEQIRLLTLRKLEILSQTLDKGDYVKRYLTILNEFLRIYYDITYRFTTQEAIKEIKKKQKNKYLIALLDEIGYLFYMKQELTKNQTKKIILDTIRILKNIKPNYSFKR